MEKQNELKKIEWFDDRFYKYIEKNGEIRYMPSVTTVLSILNKPFLSNWRGSIGNFEADRISEIAKTKGSKIHAACEKINKGEEITVNGFEQNEWLQICRYVEFLKTINPKIIETEKIIYDSVRGYAGTADLIFELNEKLEIKIGTDSLELNPGLFLVDIKTGASINENEYFMQLAAYFFGLRIEPYNNKSLNGALILHLNAKNKIGYKIYYKSAEELEEDFNAFLNCLSLFNRKALKIEPKILELPESLKWQQAEKLYSYLWVEPKEADEVRKKPKIKKETTTEATTNATTKVKVKKIKCQVNDNKNLTKSTKPKTKKIKEIQNELS